MKFTITRGATYEYTETATKTGYFSTSQVSRVLDPDAFSYVRHDVLEDAQERGEKLHYLFDFLLGYRKGLCPRPDRPDGPLGNYYDAMWNWLEKHDVLPVKIEEPSFNKKHRFAGTPDALVVYGDKRILALPDLKTGVKRRVHRVQVELYHKLEGYEAAKKLLLLYVKPDGTYEEEVVYDDPHDWAWALSALGVLVGRAAG